MRPIIGLLVCLDLAVGVGGVAADEEDRIVGSKAVFEEATSTITVPGTTEDHVQKVNRETLNLFVEAEDFDAPGSFPNLEWCVSLGGYHDKFPAGNLLNEEPQGRGCNFSGDRVMQFIQGNEGGWVRKRITIPETKRYKVWVRYQDLPAHKETFDVKIVQNPLPEEIQGVLGVPGANVGIKTEKGERIWEQTFGLGDSLTNGENIAANIWRGAEAHLMKGPATIYLVKPKDGGLEDKGAYADRVIDCVFVTSDMAYVPVGPTQLPGYEVIQERMQALKVRGEDGYVTWSRNPWMNFDLHMWPPDREVLAETLSFETAANEYRAQLLLLTSLQDKPVNLRIETTELVNAGTGVKVKDRVEVRVVAFMKSRWYGWVPEPLFRRNRLTLAPYHTGALWITVNTADLEPGEYRAELTLSSAEVPGKTVGLEVKVHPIVLPRENSLYTQTTYGGIREHFNYHPAEIRGRIKRSYFQDLIDHGTTYFYGDMLLDGVEDMVMALKTRRLLFVKVYPRKEEPETGYKKRVQDAVDAVKQRGFDYNDWVLELRDEGYPRDYAQYVKEVDSRIRITCTLAWSKYHDLDFINGLGTDMDMWKIYADQIYRRNCFEYIRSTGKPIYIFYKCDGFFSKNPAMCWSYFRRLAWISFKYGIGGVSFWAYDGGYCDRWNDFPEQGFRDSRYPDAVTVYPGSNGPIPTRNWEAFREGIQDYKYLVMLKELIAQKMGAQPQREEAGKILAAAVDDVLSADISPQRIEAARTQVVQQILRLIGNTEK